MRPAARRFRAGHHRVGRDPRQPLVDQVLVGLAAAEVRGVRRAGVAVGRLHEDEAARRPRRVWRRRHVEVAVEEAPRPVVADRERIRPAAHRTAVTYGGRLASSASRSFRRLKCGEFDRSTGYADALNRFLGSHGRRRVCLGGGSMWMIASAICGYCAIRRSLTTCDSACASISGMSGGSQTWRSRNT